MTTPVGSIKLDLTIDGLGLPAEVLASVHKAIEPTLKKLNHDLDTLQRKLAETGRAGEQSATKQVVANRGLAEAVEKVGREQEKAAAKTAASSTLSVRSINNITKALDKQTAALAANTAARAANAAAPIGGPPPRGGGGGGGGGRGGGFGGGGGLGGFLTGPVGLNAIALGASALPAATTAVVNLVGAVQQLGQAGLVVPGIFAGIGASVATSIVGLHGMTDAVSALSEAMKTGDPKDLEKAQELLKDMAPAAVDLAKSIATLNNGPLKDLRKNTSQRLLGGVAKEFDDFATKQLPRVEAGMGKVADAQNGAIKELLRVGGSDSTGSFIDRIFGNTAEAQTRANKAIEPLVHGFGTLATTGTSFLPRLADGVGRLATRFDTFITAADKDGRLAKWIDEGFKAAGNFGESLLNIGKIITDITGAAGGDGGFLKWLRDATGALRALTSSDEGQAKLKKFFEEGQAKLDEWLPVLKNAVTVAGDVVQGFQHWGDIILPIIGNILSALNALGGNGGGAIGAVVTGFLAFRTLSPFASLLGDIGKVNTGLGGLSGKLGALKKAGIIGGLALGIDGASDAGQNGLSWSNAAQSAGGGAIAGFAVGGPVGALIGAITGLTAAVIADRLQREGKVKDDAANVQKILDGPDSLPVGVGNFINPRTTAQIEQDKKTALRDFNARTNSYTDPLTGKTTPFVPKSNLEQQVDLGNDSQASQYARQALIESGQTTAADLNDRIGRARDTLDKVRKLGPDATSVTASGDFQINDPTPAVLKNVKELGLAIENLPGGQVVIKDNSDEISNNVDRLKKAIANIPGSANIVVQYTLNGQPISLDQLRTPIRVAATPGGTAPTVGGGRAAGGVIPGYSPGVDNVLYPLSGGEGILIPEAVRALGGAPGIYAINSRFRAGLSRQGYADGGVHLGTGAPPGPPDDTSQIGVLLQIRDLLAGKGGSSPLVDTAQAVSSIADGTKTTATGTQMGPFGTPLKRRGDPAYGAARGALEALGFDAETIIGADPSQYFGAGGPGGIAGAAGIPDLGKYAAALSTFAKSGTVSDVTGLGLDANDSVVKAIVNARNKKKGGLDDASIAGLVNQVLTGGGFTGTLDSTNTPLVSALQTFSEKLLKGKVPGAPTIANGGLAGPGAPGGIDAAILAGIPAGVYTNGPGDLSKGLADCSSAVEDLVNRLNGQPTAGRTVSTGNLEQFLLSRGFQVNTTGANIPGALNIGMNAGHTQATLPEGTNFNWGSDAAAAAAGLNGDGAFGAGLTKQFYRMVDGAVPGGIAGMAPGASIGAGGVQSVFVTNWPGQPVTGGPGGPGGLLGGPAGPGGATNYGGKSVVDAATQGVAAAGSDVAGSLVDAILSGTDFKTGTPTGPGTTLEGLLKERNPLAAASAFGFNVPDYTRRGGEGAVEDDPNAPSFDAKGRMFSDTGTLIDRTMTDLQTQMKAQFDQTLAVFDQIKNRLGEDVLKPVVQNAVADGIKGLGDSFTSQIGTQLGQTAGPIIANAVKSAIPASTGAPAGNLASGGGQFVLPLPQLFADGGGITGGTPGKDSVPAWLMPGEHVFTTADVARMGGQAGVYQFRRALAAGQVQGFATGGGVIGNDTVGADFFGVSQIPIIGAIVNLLVKVLLKMIGVDIEVRDTLDEMSDSVRQFRGDFQKFDATGRLINDTSGLVDRSSTSEQEAADERIRILKKVIEGIIKFIIEKVIVPIGKAIGNALVQAAGTAASGAIAGAGGGPAGGIVGAAISSLGTALVDIGGDLFVNFANALVPVLIDGISEGLQSFFPHLLTTIFGGGLMESLTSPFTGFLDTITNIFGGGLGGIFGGLFGGLAFDQGGVAQGVGLMTKATIKPERVLSPSNTVSFDELPGRLDRLASALESGAAGGARIVQVGDQHFHGQHAPEDAANELLSLLGGS
ncbi:hypothetical protein H7K45_27695 [Mycobacterium yunnanensis]|uniref:Tape measure protein n=1 Tax=Mycobacterium yunnanensis TaxID=368477 RepID=A0A9X2Z8T9_9MYCO|nr:hypothetical protein [Mycobacterium yunnanensis]MCV7424336.1 hypothetical protein [Mycobacterium yunnanensis]